MPDGWVHAVIDLISYGRPYFDLHKEKDKAHKILGSNHRIVDHDWYKAYARYWDFKNPFPSWLKESIRILANKEGAEKAEKQMALVDHDYIDRIWDNLSSQEKKYREGFFAWIVFNPEVLKEWAGVDVLYGRIQRLIDGREVWEYCPEVIFEYRRLSKYVKAVKHKDVILQKIIQRYG
jgi:hypothetical protein